MTELSKHLFTKLSFVILILLIVSALIRAHASELHVVDGDTLKFAGTTYRLHGIDAPEAGQKCNRRNGRKWRCGSESTKALEALVTGKTVKCEELGPDGYGRIIAVCTADGVELNDRLVRNGYAWAYRNYSSDYIQAENEARSEFAGVWQAQSETPWEYRARRWEDVKQESPHSCPIKGNISRQGRIYHAPWSPWYKKTRINLMKGERWFCSEQEAVDAGWRAPIWGAKTK